MAGKKAKVAEPKKGSGTLQKQFIKIMEEQGKPTDFWTVADMVEASGYDKRQVDNAMGNAWRACKIERHRDNAAAATGWGAARYALKVKDEDRKVYTPTPAGVAGHAKRRGIKATPKEIRMAFMQVQNSLAKLEDMIMPIIEDAEEKDKMLNKLKNML